MPKRAKRDEIVNEAREIIVEHPDYGRTRVNRILKERYGRGLRKQVIDDLKRETFGIKKSVRIKETVRSVPQGRLKYTSVFSERLPSIEQSTVGFRWHSYGVSTAIETPRRYYRWVDYHGFKLLRIERTAKSIVPSDIIDNLAVSLKQARLRYGRDVIFSVHFLFTVTLSNKRSSAIAQYNSGNVTEVNVLSRDISIAGESLNELQTRLNELATSLTSQYVWAISTTLTIYRKLAV